MFEYLLMGLSAIVFIAAIFGRRPVNSLTYYIFLMIIIGTYFIINGQILTALIFTLLIPSVLAIVIKGSINFLDLEKEFQPQYSKTATTVIGVIVSALWAGAMLLIMLNLAKEEIIQMPEVGYFSYLGISLSLIVLVNIVIISILATKIESGDKYER